MARRTLTTATAAFAASAALLLTACGGSDDSSSDDIKGADTGSSSPSASVSASAASDADRPDIKLPDSFQADFEGWTNSDPELQTALDDGKERLRASYAAIIDGDPEASYLAYYSGTSALSTGSAWVKGYKGLTITGEVKAYDPEISYLGDAKSRATLFYCVDESKGFSKDLKTGETAGTPEGESPKVLYRTSLGKQANGVWKTLTVETEPGGC
ncbi:hypothetical protein OHT59_19515 [Streptomyces sp. NBC_00243]|uniref:hypothetical protein n=1 Tax=Streptomyces sp. NBC_00243 TaxID=2975688 RepID=UPI002DD89F9D|nr:hypothetical protein [Streptomyces sp. NBC_00243]WRZ20531.1 hypothetical protein OHT59_19515 [Streptomyces sp. NBC_00243]